LLFAQQHQPELFARIGSSGVITDINVSINGIDVMGGEIVMMEVMNGIVVRYSYVIMY
jgi:hypothetical protein